MSPPKIEETDYYNYFKEFSVWLFTRKKKRLEDIPTKKSKKYFKKFVSKWNHSSLDDVYYDSEKLSAKYLSILNSNHDWSFKTSIEQSNQDDKMVEMTAPIKKAIIGPTLPPPASNGNFLSINDQILQNEELKEKSKLDARNLRKKTKREEKEMEDKKFGREKQIEEKKKLNSFLNGEKDDDFEENLDECGGESFKMAKEREKMRMDRKSEKQLRKEQIMNEKWKNYQMQEDAKVKGLIDRLGLKDRFKI